MVELSHAIGISYRTKQARALADGDAAATLVSHATGSEFPREEHVDEEADREDWI
jgi:hypothetical protein